MLERFVYEEPSSVYITAFYGVSLLGLASLVFFEIVGKNLQYSKFWNTGSKKSNQTLISSRIGMLMFYTPALLVGASSFWVFPDAGIRFLLLKSALTIHFLKRDLEVLFLHKFSGFIVLDTAIMVSMCYLSSAAGVLYFQHLTKVFPDPSIDLKYPGILVFLVGICGNFYHHYLLSKLREKGDKGYKIPRGGLFGLIICPHYLFEILTFIGVSLISQTRFACLFTLGSVLYLSARSYSTGKWYLSKFEDFPKDVKALIPFVF